jgi:hypothetical protein
MKIEQKKANMKEIELKNWSEFDQIIEKKHYRKWIFRGESDANWELKSSLHRAFEEAQEIHTNGKGKTKKLDKISHEQVMIDRFKCNAHLYLNNLPTKDDTLSWLSLMQHYGAPTRLLDFKFSPYVALFFALETGKSEAAIYLINHDSIKNDDDTLSGIDRLESYSNILTPQKAQEHSYLLAFEPTFSNQRLLAQQGLFVASNTLAESHGEILKKHNSNQVQKIIVPKELRFEGLRKLNKMNINSANIYPGLDGFCKSMYRQPTFGLEWQRRVGM